MKKIALICPDLLPCPPIRSGAIELLIDRLAPYLARLNYHVTVFSIQDKSLFNHERVNGVEFVRYPKKTYFQRLLVHLENEFFELIQIFNNQQWIQAVKKATPKSILFLSLHNLRLGHIIDDDKSLQIINTVDHIITVSKFLARDIINRYPSSSKKITNLYTGEDPSHYIPHFTPNGQKVASRMKQAMGIPHDYQIVLYVGRLVKYKGCNYLIKAMEKVRKQFPKTALVIVGSSWFGNNRKTEYISQLQKEAAKIEKFIYFTKFVPVNQISKFYTMSDIFVCPSQWEEPLARVIYEAMAAGLPVVTTKRGGNPEVIINGKNGFVIEQYNQASAFAKVINKLLSDKKIIKNMGNINRKLVCEKYNFQQYALNLNKIYSHYLEGVLLDEAQDRHPNSSC